MNDKRRLKKALKELIDKNRNKPRPGDMCVIARHTSVKRDIGKPRLGGDDVFDLLENSR